MSLVDKVVSNYELTGSLNETAKLCGISEQKVRRILLTAGVMPNSSLTRRIVSLYKSGAGVDDIASIMQMNHKSVLVHLPYIRGMYYAEYPTKNALTIRKCRRNKTIKGD